MRYLLALLVLSACACAGDDVPYTWGDFSEEIASVYCEASGPDGCDFGVDVEACTAHTAWHLCEAGGTCDVAIDADAAASALDDCQAAVDRGVDEFGETGGDATVCNTILWGDLPPECQSVFDLRPESE